MSVFFTSDLHFGHRFVAGIRGFGTIGEHDEAIRENWIKTVGKKDQVWVLGDIAVSSPDSALWILQGLPGTKHLIAGNHDGCHPMFRDSHKKQARYLTAFESVQAFARRRIAGEEVLLSHFPYEKDRGEPRYTQYRLMNEGRWLLHGHTHGDERRVGKEIHVGVDAWGLTPVSLDQIEELMKEEA